MPQFGYKISDQGHFAGSTIIYGCNPGYTLHGSSLLKCMTGERRAWDYPLPSCIGSIPFFFFFFSLLKLLSEYKQGKKILLCFAKTRIYMHLGRSI